MLRYEKPLYLWWDSYTQGEQKVTFGMIATVKMNPQVSKNPRRSRLNQGCIQSQTATERRNSVSQNEDIPMNTMKNLLIAFFILLTSDAAIAASAPVTCGSTLTRTTYTLPADLDCSNATAPITVRDRAVLNLNNHVYVGQIILDGRRAQLRDGTIECILAGTDGGPLDDPRCVRVEGTGKHTVQNVLILYRELGKFGIGIWMLSDNNSLMSNTVYRAPDSSVMILGDNRHSAAKQGHF